MERITRGFKPFKLHDKVWLESKHLKLCYASKKLAPKREGPFKIIEVLSPLNYRLELPKSWKIHPVIHATLLSPYHENNIHGTNYPSPPPDLIEGEHEYEVEAIIAHKRQGRGHVYLIKWKGYPTSDNSWEPEWNLTHATAILTKYKGRHHIAWREISYPLSTPNYSAMENTDQPLSASLTLLSPSPDDKENHPPLFTDFHTWDIIHYFDAKFETFDQYLLYLQRHLSDWQSNLYFQHFHTAYIHYRTMNNHIELLGKTLKTMEKTRDNLKGTMNRLASVLHEKGLQNKIRSITNHTQPPSVSVRGHPPNPVSLTKSDNPALTSIPTPYVPPHRRVHFKDLIVT